MHVCKKLLSYYKIKMSDISRLLDNIEDKIEQIGRVLASVPVRTPIHAPIQSLFFIKNTLKEMKDWLNIDTSELLVILIQKYTNTPKNLSNLSKIDNFLKTKKIKCLKSVYIFQLKTFNNISLLDGNRKNKILSNYNLIGDNYIRELSENDKNNIYIVDINSNNIFNENQLIIQNLLAIKQNQILYNIHQSSPIKLHFSIEKYMSDDPRRFGENIKFKQLFNTIIKVNGDGECFYRSVLYSLFISIFMHNDKNYAVRCINQLKIFFYHKIFNDFFDKFIIIIQNNLSYIIFLLLYSVYDLLFIIQCRKNILEIISINNNFNLGGGITLIQQVKEYDIENSISSFEGLSKLGTFANGIIINLLPFILGCKSSCLVCVINTMYTPTYNDFNNFKGIQNKFIPENNIKLPNINLIYSTIHYDVLLPNNNNHNIMKTINLAPVNTTMYVNSIKYTLISGNNLSFIELYRNCLNIIKLLNTESILDSSIINNIIKSILLKYFEHHKFTEEQIINYLFGNTIYELNYTDNLIIDCLLPVIKKKLLLINKKIYEDSFTNQQIKKYIHLALAKIK